MSNGVPIFGQQPERQRTIYGPHEETLRELSLEDLAQGAQETPEGLYQERVAEPETFTEEEPLEEEIPIGPPEKSVEQLREEIRAEKLKRAPLKLERDIQKTSKIAGLSREQQEIRRYGGAGYQRAERGLKTAGGIAKKIGTLGGPLRKPDRDYYIPKATAQTYIPTGMRYLTSMGQQGQQPLKTAGAPSLERLRSQTDPGKFRFGPPVGQKAIGMGGLNLGQSLMRLKSLGAPKGLSPIEQIVARQVVSSRGLSPIQKLILGQIQSTPEIDTKESIYGSLEKIGVPRERTEQELGALVQGGMVRQAQGGYEVA